MDLRKELMLSTPNEQRFDDRADLAYFVSKIIRNWNVITILITVLAWLFVSYGIYFRFDNHLADTQAHLSVAQAQVLEELQQKQVIERVIIVERRLAIVEKLIELGHTDPATIGQILEAIENYESTTGIKQTK